MNPIFTLLHTATASIPPCSACPDIMPVARPLLKNQVAPVPGPDGLVHFTPVAPPTETDLVRLAGLTQYTADSKPYADLLNIDISTFHDGPEAQKKLAAQVHEAMTTQGFFVLTGHALSQEEIARQVDIGYVSGQLRRAAVRKWPSQAWGLIPDRA